MVDVLALHIRAQNAGLIIRRLPNEVSFEVFEVSPKNQVVMSTSGKLRCSYPESAVALPTQTFLNKFFLMEISSFLTQMDVDRIDEVTPKTKKAGEHVVETRDTTDPRYISELLIAILGGLGHPIEIQRITKRVADEVLWLDAAKPWRRAPLWLVIRVALQTTLKCCHEYKSFMVFMLSQLVSLAVKHDICSDLLFTMRAKVARRFYKLSESPTPAFVNTIVEATVKEASKLLQYRWSAIQSKQAHSPPWNPSSWDLESATTLTLPNSRNYITNVLRRHRDIAVESFTPEDPCRLRRISDLARYQGDGLTKVFQRQGLVALHDFEESVQNSIDLWVEDNLTNQDACTILSSCFSQYYDAAKGGIVSNPEEGSINILTLMDLWVALDKISIAQFPLLHDYVPDIPCTFLHPLLFRHAHFIQRADVIEQHIVGRYTRAKYSSVFSDATTATSVSIRYFRHSKTLQDLKARIESHATVERSSKAAKLKQLNQEYTNLMSQSGALEHTNTHGVRKGRSYSKHKPSSCRKCKLESKAKGLTISVHEWPLPSNQLEAEQVVFELACPKVFSIWRTVTFSMLCTVGVASLVGAAHAEHDLPSSDLKKWIEQPTWKRITLGSTTKQFTHSHYRPCKIPATESTVLLNHGSHWRLYDRNSGTWASNRFVGSNVASYGTYCLSPSSPYAYLQHTLASTTHTSNQVLAEQANCPPELTLHEHIAFGSLRSGGRLQWLNVVRELASNALSFEREEVHQLLTQAMCQLGPLSSDDSDLVREWHKELTSSDFSSSLLDVLETLLAGVEASWRQVVTLRTIGMLISIFRIP